jgi:Trypsin-like peptidase domain
MAGFGTGFLFAHNKDSSVAAITTASYVVVTALDWRQPVKIWHPRSKKTVYLEQDDRAAWVDRKHDAATILVTSKIFKFPPDVLPLVPERKIKRIGSEVAWLGFPHLEKSKICFFSGAISAHVGAGDSYLIDGVAINGVSGGPVFDDAGKTPQLVGVVSAYVASRRWGESLPGLLQAQDLTPFHDTIKRLKSIDEAIEQEQEQQKRVEQSKQGPEPAQSSPPREPSKTSSSYPGVMRSNDKIRVKF